MTTLWSDSIEVTEGSVVRISAEVLSTESFTLSIRSVSLGFEVTFSDTKSPQILPEGFDNILSTTFLNKVSKDGGYKVGADVFTIARARADFTAEITSGDASLMNVSVGV